MPIQAFPSELLFKCLSYLPTCYLPDASLVSRSWLAPSREIYWSRQDVLLLDATADWFAHVLGPSTTITREVRTLRVDDGENDLDADGRESWVRNLATIMRHFSTNSELLLKMNLCEISESYRLELLKTARPQKLLAIQWLQVEHEHEAMDLILNQPNISFLGLGTVKEKQIWDRDRNRNEFYESKKAELERAANGALPLSTEPVIRLENLQHLCIWAPVEDIFHKVWYNIIPKLSRAHLPKLDTLVAKCRHRRALSNLISTTALSLRSLAISFETYGPSIILPEMPSLTNLSIGLASYPNIPDVLADTLATVSSAPTTVERIYLNISLKIFMPEYQLPDAAVWAALDATMAVMPSLRQITVFLVVDSLAKSNKVSKKYGDDILKYVEKQLPVSNSKYVINVTIYDGSWIEYAFADDDGGGDNERWQATSVTAMDLFD